MAKEMNVTYDFNEKQLVCKLPEQMMDVLLKIRTKTGEHTFWEDVYTHTLKYCRWNNQLRSFRSLKKRVANIFHKRNSMSDDTRGTSSQSVINTMERGSKERSIVNDSVRSSIHSNWSDLFPMDIESEYRKIYGSRRRPDTKAHGTIPLTNPPAEVAAVSPTSPTTHKTIKNITLVPFTSKPHKWGSWQIKSHHASSTANTPSVQEKAEDQVEKKRKENWLMNLTALLILQSSCQSFMRMNKLLYYYV